MFNFRDRCFQILGWFYQINDFFVTYNWKKKQVEKISDKEKFLVGPVDNLQSNCNSNFQENAVKEYYKNGVGSWFDTFMQKTLYF